MRQIALALALIATPVAAADPTFDELVTKYGDLVKQAAEIEKAKVATAEKLRALHAENQKKLADAGIIAPGPIPPAPEPKPVDPLKAKLKAAFDLDGKPTAAAHTLAELYRQSAKLAKLPEITTTAILKKRVNETAAALLSEFSPDSLKAVRAVVTEEWTATLGKVDDDPITAGERDAAAGLFTRLAEILGAF